MMPIFGQDGDLFVLAGDGTLYELSYESPGDPERQFPNFEEALEALAKATREKSDE